MADDVKASHQLMCLSTSSVSTMLCKTGHAWSCADWDTIGFCSWARSVKLNPLSSLRKYRKRRKFSFQPKAARCSFLLSPNLIQDSAALGAWSKELHFAPLRDNEVKKKLGKDMLDFKINYSNSFTPLSSGTTREFVQLTNSMSRFFIAISCTWNKRFASYCYLCICYFLKPLN